MIKSNKSYLKRFKITRNNKIIARKPGQNHFNAKESAKTGINKRRSAEVIMSNKAMSRFLANI